MIEHLDHNGLWVLLVYAIALSALLAAFAVTVARTRARKKYLETNKDRTH